MLEAKENILAFRHYPQTHLRRVWSTNLIERLNEEVIHCTRVVGIFHNDAEITCLMGTELLEKNEHWNLWGRRMFSAESMTAIPALDALPAQASLQEAAA